VAEVGGEEQVTGDTSAALRDRAGTADVFISYASADKAAADSICVALERGGLTCWIAPRDVKPGARYADAIVRAITEANALVLILSTSAIGSDHVAREIERAASKHKQVIAFRIDATPLSPEFEYFLSNSQWIDVPALGMPAALAKLAGAVGSAATNAADRVIEATPGRGARKSTRRIAVVTSAVVGVGVAVTFGVRFWMSSHNAAQPAAVAAIVNKSIAVLPFVDMSEKKDQEYFADGMAEEILDLLAKIPDLKVIGRTSSFQFKGKNGDLRAIGEKLNAAYVLEGSVRKSVDRVRITAQLINTQTGTHEWSETYDRHIDDVLTLQDAIATSVVRELQLTVVPGYLQPRTTLASPEAYDLMLRGRHAVDRLDKEGFDEAATLFQQALDLDPKSADAAASLAWTYDVQGEFGYLAPAVAFEQARHAAATALKLDPQSALAHLVLGRINMVYDWDWAAAEREFHQVAKLAPGKGDARDSEALLSLVRGRWDDALGKINAALAQDPLDPPSVWVLTLIQLRRDHLLEAEAAARRALDIRPTFAWGHWNLGLVLLARGDHDAALAEMQQETADDGKLAGLAMVYHALGRKAESDRALVRLVKEHADLSAFEIAEVYAFRGQSDEAMQWLERAYAQKDVGLLYVNGDTPLKGIEADPRLSEFLRKMNLP
jgi:TolB-like protein/Tfp pilus assembly protein PilF